MTTIFWDIDIHIFDYNTNVITQLLSKYGVWIQSGQDVNGPGWPWPPSSQY